MFKYTFEGYFNNYYLNSISWSIIPDNKRKTISFSKNIINSLIQEYNIQTREQCKYRIYFRLFNPISDHRNYLMESDMYSEYYQIYDGFTIDYVKRIKNV